MYIIGSFSLDTNLDLNISLYHYSSIVSLYVLWQELGDAGTEVVILLIEGKVLIKVFLSGSFLNFARIHVASGIWCKQKAEL